jgi:hypothetical protein
MFSVFIHFVSGFSAFRFRFTLCSNCLDFYSETYIVFLYNIGN